MNKNILLVTDGIFHPPLLGRLTLQRVLRQMEGFSFEHIRSLEQLPADLERFSGMLLHFHHKAISPAALMKLDGFVKNGGGILAIHAATASFKETRSYFDILGGRFIGHGKVENFEIINQHSGIFSGIPNFSVKDELYIHEVNERISGSIHGHARRQGCAGGMDISIWPWQGLLCSTRARIRHDGQPGLSGSTAARPGMGDGMNKLSLAIVGCGDIAGFTALVSKLVRQVTLSACCDVNAQRAQAFAKRYRIPQVFTDYGSLLDETRIEAVYLAVPHYLHYEMIRAAVSARKPVFVEKPVTRTLEEGINLVKAGLRQKVGVNYQYRYDSACYALGRAIQSGALGKIHSIRINIPWHRTQGYFDDAALAQDDRQAGGGTLITQGSHFLDVALWALGEPPVSAMGYTATPGFDVEVETLAHGIVETAGGTLVSISIHHGGSKPSRR